MKYSVIIGVIAGIIMILAGVLTALQITPEITAKGLELELGIWRVLAGIIVLGSSFYILKNKLASWVIIFFAVFEIFVFFIEKDYTLLVLGPLIAILAGILGLFNK